MSTHPKHDASTSTVAIVGAGIAGMHAALLLAEAGRRVALIERAPGIGGSLHLLERTFPSDSCGLCFLEPEPAPTYCPTFVCARHPLVDIHTLTSVVRVEGDVGHFRLTLERAPRYVNVDTCDGCGACEAVCPVAGTPRDQGMIEPLKAIHRPPARAVPAAYVVDIYRCTRCGRCVEACPRGAIDLSQQPQTLELDAGAIIAAPGFGLFPAQRKGEYGYGVLDNVVTSLEFERMLNAAAGHVGAGRLPRLADGQPIQRIAFISCVGSRDPSADRPYCSSLCCTITAKQAAAAQGVDPQVEACVFFMDLRASGEANERYLDQGTRRPGIRYERCQVSTIKQLQQSRKLLIAYVDAAGARREEEFDLAVLAVGFGAPENAQSTLATGLGIQLDAFGLAVTDPLSPLQTTRPGILAAGAFCAPKDIAETIADAGAAASAAAALVPPASPGAEPAGPPAQAGESAPDEDAPLLGVFLCDAPSALPTERLSNLLARVERLPGVSAAYAIPSLRSLEGRDALLRACAESGVNRLVLVDAGIQRDAAFDASVAQALAALGLTDASLAVVDMNPLAGRGVEERARYLQSSVAMAVAGLRRRPLAPRPALQPPPLGVPTVLVVGGGPAGLAATQALAKLGCRVELVESDARLGGRGHAVAGAAPQAWLARQMLAVADETGVSVHLGAALRRVRRAGDDRFVAEIDRQGLERTITADALIVATGARPATTQQFGYGSDARIVTQAELESALHSADDSLAGCRSLVMIQCVGSRDEERPSCSRTCCAQAVANALQLKQRHPDIDISVLFREMQTPGRRELDYARARSAGVRFLRYAASAGPVVQIGADRALSVQVVDPLLRRPVELKPDRIVLSVGWEPAPVGGWMADLGLTFTPAGYLQAEHEKLRPLHTTRAGVFACGAALGPCFLDEAIVQGRAAAIYATLHAERRLRGRRASAFVSSVDERLCSGCALCVPACPFEARSLNAESGVAAVDERLCEGCGICAMVCPNGATQQRLFGTRSVLAMVSAALD